MGGVEPGELVRDADTAMYRAKAAGGGRHAVFQHHMHERAVSRLNMEIELRRAVEAEELGVCYQPIVELATGRIAGFEALARWDDESRGSVSPVEFIPVSEETGLIGPLGRWVLGEACRQMADWQKRAVVQPGMTMSVNISSRQIARSDLVEEVREVLGQTGLPGRSLRLEITESVIMDEPHAVRSVLARLASELGVTPQIDDFGTGYSSLAFLHRFPGDVLKVDRSFVAGMQHESDNREMVRAILALAHSLKMHAIAEGVETVAQLEHLRALGCEYAQGFILSRPLPAGEVETLLANWSGGPSLGHRTRLRSPGMPRHA